MLHARARVCVRGLAAALTLVALGGCSVLPHRPYMAAKHPGTPCTANGSVDSLRATPEVNENYTLHFVEFDDQGWAFPDPGAEPGDNVGTPSRQIECAIADLRNTLEKDKANVLSFVYVHGWKHSAANDDNDVKRFRELLRSRAKLFHDRRIVGIYVGWQGNTMDLWGINNLTFWGRKNAAGHVAEGRVRELFSRLRGLRAYWNGPQGNSPHACDWKPSGYDRCRLRTVMIGHSFGGLIMFNSAAPYLLETLSLERDLPADPNRPRATRARGIADLIVLLNPAFEGSRYEPVFEASQHYASDGSEPPLLVLLTSTADRATKNAFPIARWINSVFQYPASSDDQSDAMRRTPGHIERYLTHKLCNGDAECRGDAPSGLTWGPARRCLGGLLLRAYDTQPPRRYPPVVWNVRTHDDVIPDHNDIDRPEVFGFIEQIYQAVTGADSAVCSAETLTH